LTVAAGENAVVILPGVIMTASVLWLIRSHRRNLKDLGLTLSLAHAGVISAFALCLYFPIQALPEGSLAWALFMLADFPASLLLVFLGFLMSVMKASVSGIAANWLLPYVVLGLAGSLQYYFIGKLVEARDNKKAEKP